MTLSDSGFFVEAVCLPGNALQKTSAVRRTYPFRGLSPSDSFREAIAQAQPDLIIPGDDFAADQLHSLYAGEIQLGRHGSRLCALLEKSLGSARSFPIVQDRAQFITLAKEEGLRVPESSALHNASELAEWVTRFGVPAVIKANGTSGGEGVRVARTLEEAQRAFRVLQAPPSLARAIKRSLWDRDLTMLRPSLLRERNPIGVQSFIAGQDSTSLVACWEGKVIAALHFLVIKKGEVSGHSSVLRAIENEDMQKAAERMVRRLNLSGLHGFDFMLEAETGNAYLIEINPRATQVGHLRLGPGRDLPAALYSAVTGSVLREAPKITQSQTIVLFPQEWLRDPESEFLRSGYHDVPWEESEFIQACITKSKKWHSKSAKKARIDAFWRSVGEPYRKSQIGPPDSLVAGRTK